MSDSEDQNEALSPGSMREQDRYLPIANISRIMKKSIPEHAKIAKDAKECVQECVSEFISFITSEASEKCAAEKRKTINGEDILYAMQALGFDQYYEPLKIYLAKYREQGEKTGSPTKQRSPTKYLPKKDGELESGSGSQSTPSHLNSPLYPGGYNLPPAQYPVGMMNLPQQYSDDASRSEHHQ